MRNPFTRKKGAHSIDYSAVVRSVRTRDQGRFRWLRRKWVLISLGALVLLGAAGGYVAWFYYSLQADVQEDLPDVDPQEDDEKPFIVLLVGSDSRKGLTEQEQEELGADDETAAGIAVTGQRADTIILGQVDPETNHVTMVQFPRDLYVPMPGGARGRINEALQQGENYLVKTVEQLTGLDVHHYAQVNLAGFRDLVDAIDGVEVCIPKPIPFDSATGIEVKPDEVGMIEFDGDRAIRFVRSRKVFGEGDFARIQNQQKFLAAAIDKVTSPSTFLSWGRIQKLKDVAGKNFVVDSNTGLWEFYGILRRFRSFNPQDYEAYTAPNLGLATTEGGASIVRPDMRAMRAMFNAMAENKSPGEADDVPNIAPNTIRVGVYNGTSEDGAAAAAAERIKAAATTSEGTVGVEEIDDADHFGYKQSVIRFEKENKAMARFMAAIVPDAKMKKHNVEPGVDVEVIVGRRFKTSKVVQILPIPIPKPGALPEVCRE
jgi:LCP family protein required for cell wall assembly